MDYFENILDNNEMLFYYDNGNACFIGYVTEIWQ